MTDYKEKYFKYKNKYSSIKNQLEKISTECINELKEIDKNK